MATEKVVRKAQNMLAEGRVKITYAHGGEFVAVVHGDHSAYAVTKVPGDRYRCVCPSLKYRCSHAIAVELVTKPKP